MNKQELCLGIAVFLITFSIGILNDVVHTPIEPIFTIVKPIACIGDACGDMNDISTSLFFCVNYRIGAIELM